MTRDPTDAEAVLSALDFNANWLIEVSNENPLSLIGCEERLYSIMSRLQFVASRFARVCNDNKDEFEHDLNVLRELRDSDPRWKAASLRALARGSEGSGR